jgi:hypothetical protein
MKKVLISQEEVKGILKKNKFDMLVDKMQFCEIAHDANYIWLEIFDMVSEEEDKNKEYKLIRKCAISHNEVIKIIEYSDLIDIYIRPSK